MSRSSTSTLTDFILCFLQCNFTPSIFYILFLQKLAFWETIACKRPCLWRNCSSWAPSAGAKIAPNSCFASWICFSGDDATALGASTLSSTISLLDLKCKLWFSRSSTPRLIWLNPYLISALCWLFFYTTAAIFLSRQYLTSSGLIWSEKLSLRSISFNPSLRLPGEPSDWELRSSTCSIWGSFCFAMMSYTMMSSMSLLLNLEFNSSGDMAKVSKKGQCLRTRHNLPLLISCASDNFGNSMIKIRPSTNIDWSCYSERPAHFWSAALKMAAILCWY